MKRNGSKRWIVGLASFAVLGMLSAVSVQSALADQIVVCQSCDHALAGDPNVITNPSSFNMFIEGSGKLDAAPTLIIIAQYNGVGVPTVNVGGPLALAGVGTLGLDFNPVSLTPPASNDVMDALGLTGGGSLNFGNLSTADVGAGFAAPTSFTLYAFQFNGQIGSFPSLTVSTTASNGSFVFGYACKVSSTDADCPNGKVSQSVMTNGGLINGPPVPEPGSALLLGAGLAGVGLWMWRRQRNVQG